MILTLIKDNSTFSRGIMDNNQTDRKSPTKTGLILAAVLLNMRGENPAPQTDRCTSRLRQQHRAPVGALEEIVVTAQKREAELYRTSVLRCPAISGADLVALGAVTATDITKSMPAVVLTQPNGPSSFTLSIRGITQNDFADHQESPAAIYVDDV